MYFLTGLVGCDTTFIYHVERPANILVLGRQIETSHADFNISRKITRMTANNVSNLLKADLSIKTVCLYLLLSTSLERYILIGLRISDRQGLAKCEGISALMF